MQVPTRRATITYFVYLLQIQLINHLIAFYNVTRLIWWHRNNQLSGSIEYFRVQWWRTNRNRMRWVVFLKIFFYICHLLIFLVLDWDIPLNILFRFFWLGNLLRNVVLLTLSIINDSDVRRVTGCFWLVVNWLCRYGTIWWKNSVCFAKASYMHMTSF